MAANGLEQIVEPLLDWYRDNARVLPWRENEDFGQNPDDASDGTAYRVWVSEIMLQQTRVETVVPYYERFMRQYPDVWALAGAQEDSLLKLWEGLGYYSRVRNMQKAAQIICRDYGGHFPRQYAEVIRLPGIGAYTAGAICSIAFEEAFPAVDGNVLRVVTRLTRDGADIGDVRVRQRITDALRAVYPAQERGNFTQSLMELGAVVCVPNGAPKCAECPVREHCGAYRAGAQLCYPVKKKKAERRIEEKTVLVLWHDGRIASKRRERQGLLAGMWELPNIDGYYDAAEVTRQLSVCGLAARQVRALPDKKHIFTHVEWRMRCFAVACLPSAASEEKDTRPEASAECPFAWVTPKALEQEIALPTAFQKVIQGFVKTASAKSPNLPGYEADSEAFPFPG